MTSPLRYICRIISLLFALSAAAPGAAAADRITVFAAASLKTALDEIAQAYEEDTGRTVAISYAGSSVLARQIELGAPADVYISANPGWMDRLEGAGHLLPGTRENLLGNRLVLIAHDAQAASIVLGPDTDLVGRLDGGRLAMALVDAVPAGIYGKAALESLGLWQAVAPHLAQADNVRAALALVALGEAPLGIVYATDAHADPSVKVIATFPESSHPPIIYPAAALAGGQEGPARAFLRFLRGPRARAAFERQGFTMLEP